MITVKEMQEDYNWKEAWAYGCKPQLCAGADPSTSLDDVKLEDVVRVLDACEGENDGPEWIAVVRLKDGRYAFLTAGCDYTGWDCQAGGQCWVSKDLKNLRRFGVTQEARERFDAAEGT